MRFRRAAVAIGSAVAIAVTGWGCTAADQGPTTMTPIDSTAPSSGSTPTGGESASGDTAGDGSTDGEDRPGVPNEVVEQARETIEAVNAAAGTSPEQQRTVFEKVVDPEFADRQRSCGAATTTVRFEPSWNDLRPTPRGDSNSYQLPALIRVYTGDRITRTDVTSLTITISAGQAHLPPLCVA